MGYYVYDLRQCCYIRRQLRSGDCSYVYQSQVIAEYGITEDKRMPMVISTTLDVDVSDGKAVNDNGSATREQEKVSDSEPKKDEKSASVPKQPRETAGM